MNERFVWCFANGCGDTRPKRIEFEYMRSETMDGRLIESKTIPKLVSFCCEADLMLWDNERDEQLYCEVVQP